MRKKHRIESMYGSFFESVAVLRTGEQGSRLGRHLLGGGMLLTYRGIGILVPPAAEKVSCTEAV